MGKSFRWYIYGDRADDLLISRLRKLSSAIIVSVCVRRLLRVRCVCGEREMKAEGLIQVGNGTKLHPNAELCYSGKTPRSVRRSFYQNR